MGACSARIFERGDAGRLIGICARRQPGVDISHLKDAVLSRVEISVEHAIIASELQLEAGTFLNLQGRPTEMRGQVMGRHSGEARHLPLHRNDRRLFGRGGLFGPRGAGCEEKDRGEGEAAHGQGMPARLL